jgi:hypothetical protein
MMKVGTSSRTPYKHWLYNSHLGKLVATTATGKTPCKRSVVVFDLCAGDGQDIIASKDPREWRKSSPTITRNHMTSPLPCGYLERREAFLYERERATFDRLKSRFGDAPQLNLFNMDSREASLRDHIAHDRECVFVYADPNHAASIPLTPEIISEFTPYTLCMMTLGCNVGGLKRVPLDERELWFEKVEAILARLHRGHDAHLIWLKEDASQWAYLITLPLKWSEDKLREAVAASTRWWPPGVGALSYRNSRELIDEQLNKLFLTKEEMTNHATHS